MKRYLIALTAASLAAVSPARAEPTEIVARAISEDAKFIGDSMGGANIVLRDARSGRILARGVTSGGTGNTARIMQSSGRSPLIATPDAAAFVTRIDIDQPMLVDLEVVGPNARPGSSVSIRSQRWVMPGEAVNVGDGWVVELPGLAISPSLRILNRDESDPTRTVAVAAKVQLLCGCPITPGGMWNSADYRVTASVWQGNRELSETSLDFVEAPGGFAGQIAVPTRGRLRVYIRARNIVTGNSGVTEASLPQR